MNQSDVIRQFIFSQISLITRDSGDRCIIRDPVDL